ncbi:hypothetical protein J7432_19090 [Xanthomonas axonopodis pv. begoniae]|nr:hypothetical protein [Xanthomonas axonopodis pv. begoniae]MBO9774135.1 hypothetical protein [Xanthomonas axonopodis pv. begoniae]PPT29249.1 hypothetical protein XabCFBP2524_22025 [Xanthomonas axonopodis pv. begoniae]
MTWVTRRVQPMSPRQTGTGRRFFSLSLMLLAAGLQGACADPRGDSTTPSASAPVTAQHTTAGDRSESSKPRISSQELEARLLRFVDGFKSPADMNYMRLEAALGAKFGGTSDSVHPFHVMKNVPLSDGYTFYATHIPAEKIFASMEVAVGFPEGIDPTRTPTSRCVWDATTLSRKLEEIGYKRGGQRPFQGGWLRQHWRPLNDGTQDFSVALLIYRTSQDSGSRECAYGIQIDGGKS